MAVTFIKAADLGESGGGTSHTASFTVDAGTNSCLVVSCNGDATSDFVTGATYNGNAMTLEKKQAPGDAGDYWSYIFTLAGPATGAHDVVISASSSCNIRAGAAQYDGVDQGDCSDANGSNSVAGFGSDLTVNITTVTDNSLVVGHICGYAGGGDLTAGSNTTRRQKDTYPTWAILERNAATSPAGATSIAATFAGSSLGMSGVAIALKPFVGGGGGTTRGMAFGNDGTAFNGGRTFVGVIR